MAVSKHTPALPKVQQRISRRAVMGSGIAATALAAVPVLAALPDPVDLVGLAKYHATELARAMSLIHGRPWQLLHSQEMSFVTAIDIERFEAVSKAAYPPKRRRKAVRA